MSSHAELYTYDATYPYLRNVVRRTGHMDYDIKNILKDYVLIYRGLQLRPGDKLLDVGSCIGSLGHYLLYAGIETCGIDINIAALREGQRIFGQERHNTSMVCNAIALPFQSGWFDAVVTEDVFEHFTTQEFAVNAFGEMVRVLNPERKQMFHKITVAEDVKHIDADPSHRLKLPTATWCSFFEAKGWVVKGSPVFRSPLREIYRGHFLIERD